MILADKLKYYFSQNNTVRQTIFKNTFWLFLAEFFINGARFLIQILLARELGVAGYGLFSFVLSFASIFMFISDFGFPVLILKNIARDKSEFRKLFDNILFIKLVLGLITFLIIMFSSQILSLEESTKALIYLAGITVIINTFSDFFRAFFRAFEKMQWEAISKIIEGALMVLIVGFIILNRRADLKEIFYGYIAVGVLVLILNAIILANKFLKKELFKKFSIDYGKIKLIFTESSSLAFLAIFVSISYYIDQIMLGIISTKTELGYYSAAQRIVHGLLMFNAIILISFLPKISYYFKENKEQLRLILNQLNKIMLAIAIPMGIFGTFFAPEIITFVFGNEYSRAILAFQILIWAQVIIFISTCYGNALVMCDRQKDVVYGVGLGAIINIILNYILISRYSLYGASVATVVTQLVIFIYMYKILNKNIIKISFHQYIAKPLLASLVVILFLFYFRESFHIIILMLFGVIFYLSLLFKFLKFKI